jgi:sugar lactone lactonase YvrE
MMRFSSFSRRSTRAMALMAAAAVLAACHAGAVTPGLTGGTPQSIPAEIASLRPTVSGDNPTTVFRGVGSAVAGLAFGPHGELYVADLNATIKKIAVTGAVSFVPSTIKPNAIAVDGAGDVFVAQTNVGATGKGIIEKITPDGTIVRIGNRKWQPYSLAADASGNLYLAQRDGVYKIAPNGKTSTVGQGFRKPTGVAVDAAGNVYVADAKAHAIKRVAPNGTITAVGHGLVNPTSVAVDGANNVYVVSQSIPLAKISSSGAIRPVAADFGTPSAIAAGASGRLAAARSNPGLVVTISPSGTIANALMGEPGGVATAKGGSIYVADPGDNNVYRIFPNGRIASVGAGFYQPKAVAVNAGGTAYVGDSNLRLYRVSPSGRTELLASKIDVLSLAVGPKGDLYVGTEAAVGRLGRNGKVTYIAGGNVGGVQCLAFDARGNLYAGDQEKLEKIAPSGTVTTIIEQATMGVAIDKTARIWGSFNGGVYVLDKNGNRTSSNFPAIAASAIAFDRAGNLYVVNQGTGVVQKFNAE